MRQAEPHSVMVFSWQPRKHITVTSSISQSTNRSDDQKPGQLHHNERPAW